jgi:hypothetical protein
LPFQATGYELRLRDVDSDIASEAFEAMRNLNVIALTRDGPCRSGSSVPKHLNSRPIRLTMRRDLACNGFAETGVQFEHICSLGWEILVRLKNAPGAHNERALRAPRHRNRYALLALAYANIGGVQSSLPWDVPFTRWELIARQQAAEPATIFCHLCRKT